MNLDNETLSLYIADMNDCFSAMLRKIANKHILAIEGIEAYGILLGFRNSISMLELIILNEVFFSQVPDQERRQGILNAVEHNRRMAEQRVSEIVSEEDYASS